MGKREGDTTVLGWHSILTLKAIKHTDDVHYKQFESFRQIGMLPKLQFFHNISWKN